MSLELRDPVDFFHWCLRRDQRCQSNFDPTDHAFELTDDIDFESVDGYEVALLL